MKILGYFAIALALILSAAGNAGADCPCGPGCPCGPSCDCIQVAPVPAPVVVTPTPVVYVRPWRWWLAPPVVIAPPAVYRPRYLVPAPVAVRPVPGHRR